MSIPKFFNISQKDDFIQRNKTLFKRNTKYVGRTGCGKTTFIQNLGKNNMFGEIKEVTWISKIPLLSERKNNIRDCFVNEIIHFKYPARVEDVDDLLEFFQKKRAHCNENYLRENVKLDRLTIMDDVSGLGDRREAFANFLTVSRKLGLTCVYIFHTLYPTRQS